jgi:hypothetical protein
MTEIVNLNVRLPASLHQRAVRDAKRNGTSLNTHIVTRLEEDSALREENRRMRHVIEQIRPELRGLLQLVATAMDAAGSTRVFLDQVYATERGPDWLDHPDGFEAAATAAARVLDALPPKRPDTFSGDAEALARSNESHGREVSRRILNRVATGEPSTSPSSRLTERLRRDLGPLLPRIKPTDEARGFEAVEIAPMTAEQKARVEEARRQETDDEDNE